MGTGGLTEVYRLSFLW